MILLSKFYLPELRPDRVDRPRLLERLRQAASCQLVIISAPAGFGKTTLVSEWVRSARVNTGWITLDESDNDPARFWSALVTAIGRLYPGAGENSQSILAARQPIAPQALLTALLNDLILQDDSQTGPERACLVLDDTHLVNNASIYEGLLYFAEHLPRYLQLVLIGRSDPPIPIGRLRASCRMLEIRAADLRFSLEESSDFLNRVMGFSLSPERIKRLEERIEGWIAGLQLAGLAMQGLNHESGSGEIDAFIENFSGQNRYILDYLVEEVLSCLAQEVRTFLLQTAILERMCGPLCDAVTGNPAGESQAVLERLERQNLFLIPLDNRRQWYRYHHLFADLLRHQRERSEGLKAAVTAEALHRRAAAWLAGQEYNAEAIGHALQGQDFESAATWIEAYAQVGFDRGEYATIKAWIDQLPQAVLNSRPGLLMHHAETLIYLGEMTKCEKPLAAAELLWRAQGNLEQLGVALNLRANLARAQGDGEKVVELAQQALGLLPEGDLHHRGVSWMYLGSGAFLQGRVDEAARAYSQAIAQCTQSGNTTGSRLAATQIAQVCQVQGDLPAAARKLEELLAQTGSLPIYEGQVAQMLLSLIWREWNRLDEAEKGLRSVLEVGEKSGQIIYFQQCYLAMALILWEKGDLDGMQAALEQHARMAEQQVEGNGGRVFGYALSALLAALFSDPQKARSWKEKNEAILHSPVSFQNEFIYLTLIRLSIGLGAEDARQALAWLGQLLDLAQAQHRFQSLSVLWMLKALGLSRLGDFESAVDALEESLKLAYPGGYQRLYLDEGQPLFELLKLLVRKPSLSPELRTYATRLLSFAPGPVSQDSIARARMANFALVEPLTAREVEVLRMVQAGLSNREIAEKLYLALNTVKVHVKNIFAKLDVKSRTQAVHRAEELGLI